jgi:DNA-directed RNA polymerase subunit RPC12/RpoP
MTIIIGKDYTLYKMISCKGCGSRLQYLPSDVEIYRQRESEDIVSEHPYVECPNCWEKIFV